MLNPFKKEAKEDSIQKTWTIVLLNTSENWYVYYLNNKLTYQIEVNNLKDFVNVVILDDISKIEENINSFGDYINIIEEGDISNNYVLTIYKAIKKCKKDCITFSGILNKNKDEFIFNQIEENDEEIFLNISQFNPIKKEIIINNLIEYLHDGLISLTTCNLNDILVFKDHIIKHEDLIVEDVIPIEPFSIILTAYQTQDFIEQCLDSIENQTYFKNNNEYEVLVGVDGCEDTLNKLNEIKDNYRNLSIYMMNENCGTYMTTNALLNLIKYDNVIRFDTDDVMEPIMIEEIVKNKTDDDDIIRLGFSEWIGDDIKNWHSAHDGIIYFKKRVMDEIAGGYQPWICGADSELLARLKNRVNIRDLNERLFLRRIHDNSLTKRKDTGYGSMIRRNYQKQIKSHYEDDEIKIERISNEINHEKYNLLFMITTYNRINFLKKTIDTWLETIDKRHNWTLVIADDGSDDGTLDWLYNLHIEDIKIYIIENKRRGVHHQTNSLLKFASNLEFDYGFKSDDDLIFLKKGWDNSYVNASLKSEYYHLIFYDKMWGNRRGEKKDDIYYHGILENSVYPDKIQGAFWTFNKKIIEDVGFYDTEAFNLCGLGHVDYSLRCCRLGYNDINNPYDLIDSNLYINLNKENYISHNDFKNLWNTKEIKIKKKEKLLEYRTYINYNQMDKNLMNEEIENYDISFIIPLRGREDQIEGLEFNLHKTFGEYKHEIIYVYQNDEELFKRGQLCNIGFKESKGEIIVFQDVDIRHLREINFKNLLDRYKKPFVAFDQISQLEENVLGEYRIIQTEDRPYGWGACSVFYREQFILSGGFSNLIFGWGSEDNIMNNRVGFIRYQQDLGHVYHEPLRKDPKVFVSDWYKNNRKMLETDSQRNPLKDGYVQTKYDFNLISKDKDIKIIKVDSIYVDGNYEYINLYKK